MAGILIFSENNDLAFEILGKGREIADKLEMEIGFVILGHEIKNDAQEFINYGADKVYIGDDEKLKDLIPEQYSKILFDLVEKIEPEIILIGSTKKGKEVASRLATKLEAGCTSDCIGLEIDSENRVLFKRVVLGGNAIATQICKTTPKIATIPLRTFEKTDPIDRSGETIDIDIEIEEPKTRIIESKKIEFTGKNIEEANIIIAGGRGIDKKKIL